METNISCKERTNTNTYISIIMAGETSHKTGMRNSVSTDGINTMQGEVVLQNRHPGWGLWWKLLALAGFFFFAGLSGGLEGIVGSLVLVGPIVGYVAFARMQSRYIVTDERIKMDIGLIRSQSREYRISDVQGIDTSQSIIAKVFRIGDIAVRTSDGTQIPWRGVPDHEEVARTIREHQRQYDSSMDRK